MDKVQEKLNAFPDTQELREWAQVEGELNDPRILDRLNGFNEDITLALQQGKFLQIFYVNNVYFKFENLN